MEMIVGKYMMESMTNMDMMAEAMGMTEDMMKKMMGSPGMMLDVMVSGDSMTMKRGDGMCMSFTIGEEFEIPLGNMMIKIMPKMDTDMLMMMMSMPDGKIVKRSYSFNKMGMQIEMMFNEMMMKVCYKRM